MKRKFFKLFVVLSAFIGSVYAISNNRSIVGQHMNAATSFTKGNKVYIGNESYTIIDPNAMTLLADQATDAGNVTWDNAVASLTTLPNQYGELGSKAVKGKFSLPKSTDLTSITNVDTLNTIDPLTSDWWLGDESVDNRSKFVGANTNSLVTDVPGIKNILDTDNHVCNTNQAVTEQGLKPTKTGNDPTKTDTYQSKETRIMLNKTGVFANIHAYQYTTKCDMNGMGTTTSFKWVTLDGTTLPSSQINAANDLGHFLYTLRLRNTVWMIT